METKKVIIEDKTTGTTPREVIKAERGKYDLSKENWGRVNSMRIKRAKKEAKEIGHALVTRADKGIQKRIQDLSKILADAKGLEDNRAKSQIAHMLLRGFLKAIKEYN